MKSKVKKWIKESCIINLGLGTSLILIGGYGTMPIFLGMGIGFLLSGVATYLDFNLGFLNNSGKDWEE